MKPLNSDLALPSHMIMENYNEAMMKPYTKPYLSAYINLMESFVDTKISAKEFESAYLDLFLNEKAGLSESDYVILNELFYHVDAYCELPELRSENEDLIDEYQLLEAAKIALAALKKLNSAERTLHP